MDAIPESLIVRQADPLNAETPTGVLARAITPAANFYVRSHLPMPDRAASGWRLTVQGAVEQPLVLSLSQLQEMGARSATATLECAGNGRAFMPRKAEGVAWQYGAVSTAEFTGVPLRRLLERARLAAAAVEIVFAGADEGEVAPGKRAAFERSLPLGAARSDDILLAWAMNGELLAPEHGYPLRLVVPGWYGMASVKWLARITAVTTPFAGYYQAERYVYVGEEGLPDHTPVTRMRVRSLITYPADGALLANQAVEIAGIAWSGRGPVARVEVSVDSGASWTRARLHPAVEPYAASAWRLPWSPQVAGPHTLIARATDSAGDTQPLESLWNVYGYGNNAVQRLHVTVLPGSLSVPVE